MRILVTSWLLAGASPAFADCEEPGNNDTADTGIRFEDCDDDGYQKMDGDCDDWDPAANPGKTEDCDNRADENCDGLFNEGCEAAASRGTLMGGTSCGTSSAAWLVLLPLLLLGGRRK